METHRRTLGEFVPFWPHELSDTSPEGRRVVIERTQDWLRRQRRDGLSGHWSYDLPRHRAVFAAYEQEKALLGA